MKSKWKIKKQGVHWYEIVNDQGEMIAQFHDIDCNSGVLMSAAPEMLEALTICSKALSEFLNDDQVDLDSYYQLRLENINSEMLEAIKKAKGE